MKYKDYYGVVGVDRKASAAEIKNAYRMLARTYHPDVSKEKDAEEKFKELGEAYETLRDPEKRAAYDQLGSHRPGQEFRPPPGWERQFGDGSFSFDDIDLGDLFAGIAGGMHRAGRRGGKVPIPGEDYEVTAHISLEDAYRGTEVDLELEVPEYDERGFPRRGKPCSARVCRFPPSQDRCASRSRRGRAPASSCGSPGAASPSRTGERATSSRSSRSRCRP